MTGIFRANNPLNTFLLFVYGLFLKFFWLLHPQIPLVEQSDGFLYNDILKAIKPGLDQYPALYFFLAYLLLFTQAVSINHIVISRRLMQKPNYLPAMSYLLITSFFPPWNIFSSVLIVNTILIWIWAKLSNLNNNQNPKATLFNIGIAIGICSFCYLPCLVFALFVIITLVIIRPPKMAEWLITCIGVLTPWYFLGAWLFFTNLLYSFHVTGIGISHPFYKPALMEIIGVSLIGFAIFTGALFVQSSASKQILQVRKNWGLLFLLLLISIGIPFLDLNGSINYWLMSLIPAAAIISCAFFYPRLKWGPAILHWLMVAFVIYNQYFQK